MTGLGRDTIVLAASVLLLALGAGDLTARTSKGVLHRPDDAPRNEAADPMVGARSRACALSPDTDCVPLAGPDLAVRYVDRAGMTGDWQALAIGGTVQVQVKNEGDASTRTGFDVALYEDVDADGQFNRGRDTLLGETHLEVMEAGDVASVDIPVSGQVTFRHNLIYALADSGNMVAEANEANNTGHTGEKCEYRPPPGRFEPALEWQWSGSSVVPASDQVMMMPTVIDLTNDGVPEIVFATYDGVTLDADGTLRAIHGDGSGEVFTVAHARYAVRGTAPTAAGDIDGDGRPEIVALAESGDALLAFEHDGTFKWRSDDLPFPYVAGTRFRGGPALADLDRDGDPEIVIGATVLDSGGTIRWSSGLGIGENRHGYGTLSLVANLDMAGDQEVVAGNTAYRSDGSTYWHLSSLGDGFNAVANLDSDNFPEIVLVTRGHVYAMEHDGTLKWGPSHLPGQADLNYGGPPTVADVDGDGQAEIGVAGRNYYTVFETDGRIRWSSRTQDISSSVTGSSVFDFDGDGAAEVVYSDETMLRIYRGTDGQVLWETPSPSGTVFELPVIADVDADGNAEIVTASNRWHAEQIFEPHGVQIYGDANDTWVRTRALWNQHTYHIDNINDDTSIPADESPSWLNHNTYRLNLPRASVFLAPDLTASRLVIDHQEYPAAVRVSARIGNGGADVVADGAPIAFYDGEPGAGAELIGVVATSRRLSPGDYEDVWIRWLSPGPGIRQIHVVADDDGSGAGRTNECDELNNEHAAPIHISPTATPTRTLTPSPTPTQTSTPTLTRTPTPTATLAPPPALYLPVALRETCDPTRMRADIVLVIDTSSSMLGSKLAEAKAAAAAFLALLDLDPGRDQVAVVRFDAEAEVTHRLTSNTSSVATAIASLDARRGTHIDKGLRTGLDELLSPRRNAANSAVILLLTDGMHNGVPKGDLAVATQVREAGVLLYTIGLGSDVDEGSLVALTGRTSHYYFAPDASRLRAMYARVAHDISCPAERYWGKR